MGSNSALSCYRNASAFANGACSTFVVAVTIGSGKAGMGDSNNAHIYTGGSAQVDPVSSNDQKTTTVLVNRRADLSLSDSASPSPVLRGQQFTVTLSTHNGGPTDVVAATLTDVLPAGATLISAPSFCSYDGSSRIVACDLGPVASGASVPVAIVLRADGAGPLSDSANVSIVGSAPVDPDLTNNTASSSVTVTPSADLAVTNSAPAYANPGPDHHLHLDGDQQHRVRVGDHLRARPDRAHHQPAGGQHRDRRHNRLHARGREVGATACKLDSQAVQCGAASLLITNLAAGPHTFTVTVTGSGGTGSDTATWTTTAAPVNTARRSSPAPRSRGGRRPAPTAPGRALPPRPSPTSGPTATPPAPTAPPSPARTFRATGPSARISAPRWS